MRRTTPPSCRTTFSSRQKAFWSSKEMWKQSPRELARLVEQISGSSKLAGEYEKAKEEQERVTDSGTFDFTERRGIVGEIKQYKEQKTEADRLEALCDERVC